MNISREPSSATPAPTIDEKFEKLLTLEPFSRQMRESGARRQREFVKRISTALQSDKKDALEVICTHLTQKGKIQSALSYVEMYLNEGGASPNTLDHIFQNIMTKAYDTNRSNDINDPRLAIPPKGLFRIVQKLEKNSIDDIDGTISLIRGKISHVFVGNVQETIDQYRLALQKNHPQVFYFLGVILTENHAMNEGYFKEGTQMFLRGWTEFSDIECLQEYIRASFFLGNDPEAIKYFQILKAVREDTPHIIAYIPVLKFPERLPLLVDYLKACHSHEGKQSINPQIYQGAIQWVRARLITLDKERGEIIETMLKLEEEGGDTTEVESQLRRAMLAILETMEVGAVYLLDTIIIANYLQNILAFFEDVPQGREILMEHMLNSECYARKWMESRSMRVTDTDDTMEVEEDEEEITHEDVTEVSNDTDPMALSPDEFSKQLTDDDTESIIDDIMGILDMVLYHSMVYHDDHIPELYAQIAEKIVPNPQALHLDTIRQDVLIEKSMFDSMPTRLREWYGELESAVDDVHSPFIRKKIQGAHRAGGTLAAPRTKDATLFLVFDGFLSDMGEERIDEYVEFLTDFDLTYTEGLNLVTTCMHFGNYGLAFELLCDGLADWSNVETLILSIHLMSKISQGETQMAEEMVRQIETSIRGQGHELESFEEFLTSSINGQFAEEEHPKNEALLYGLSGLGALLYGDEESTTEYLNKAYDLGDTSAMLDLAMVYSWRANYEGAYQAIKKVYDPKKPELALEALALAEFAIITGRHHEIPELLSHMEENNVEGSSWIHFYSLITGDKSQEIEAIRFLGIYGRNVPEGFDPAIVTMAVDRMSAISKDPESTTYERLSCLRALALLESEGQTQVFAYWQMLQELVQNENFSLLSEHLVEFTDSSIQEMFQKKTSPAKLAYEQTRVALISEAMAFRRQCKNDKDFILLFDVMIKICSLFPEHAELMQDWRASVQGSMNPEQAFTLGYNLGKFGEKTMLQ